MIEEVHNKSKSKKYITILDGVDAYWTVVMPEKYRDLFSFSIV